MIGFRKVMQRRKLWRRGRKRDVRGAEVVDCIKGLMTAFKGMRRIMIKLPQESS